MLEALRLMVGSSDKAPVKYALHSEIRGETQSAAQGASELEILGHKQLEVTHVYDLRAGVRERRRVVRFMRRIWCQNYVTPQGKERAMSLFGLT